MPSSMVGAAKSKNPCSRKLRVLAFLAPFSVACPDSTVEDQYVESPHLEALGTPISEADLWIAATAPAWAARWSRTTPGNFLASRSYPLRTGQSLEVHRVFGNPCETAGVDYVNEQRQPPPATGRRASRDHDRHESRSAAAPCRAGRSAGGWRGCRSPFLASVGLPGHRGSSPTTTGTTYSLPRRGDAVFSQLGAKVPGRPVQRFPAGPVRLDSRQHVEPPLSTRRRQCRGEDQVTAAVDKQFL